MKKIYILIICILFFCLLLLGSLLLTINDNSKEVIAYRDLSSNILEDSVWIELEKSDLNSLILKTYSNNILDIITSLENAIPVIFEVNGGQFADSNKNNFIIVSSFDSENTVSVSLPSGNNSYISKSTTLEEVLEDATRFFISKGKEV